MSFSLYDRSNVTADNNSGNLIFNRYLQDHWWLTGFKPDAQKINSDELYMIGEISFKDKAMKDAFVKQFNKMGEKDKQGMTIRESKTDSTKIFFDWKTN